MGLEKLLISTQVIEFTNGSLYMLKREGAQDHSGSTK